MNNNMKYKVKALRVGQGIKLIDFAKEIGISREYLRLIENGKAKNPSIEIMKKIAKRLNASVLDLFFDEEEEKENNIDTVVGIGRFDSVREKSKKGVNKRD